VRRFVVFSRSAPVGIAGAGIPAGATVDVAAPAGVVEPVTGGASFEPTLWQPARTIDPSAMKRSLDRIVFILLGSVI
jgi:hypothetical protein